MTTTETELLVPTLPELLGRIAQENIDALTEAGAFKVTIPRRFGGCEMTVREKLEVSTAVAESGGSTAWVVALTNVCNWMASVLPDQAQQDIFGDNQEVAEADAITKIRGAIDALLSAHGRRALPT